MFVWWVYVAKSQYGIELEMRLCEQRNLPRLQVPPLNRHGRAATGQFVERDGKDMDERQLSPYMYDSGHVRNIVWI